MEAIINLAVSSIGMAGAFFAIRGILHALQHFEDDATFWAIVNREVPLPMTITLLAVLYTLATKGLPT